MMPSIPHSKPWITDADQHAMAEVLDSGMLAPGEKTHTFEQAMAVFLNMPTAYSTQSGTLALIMALQALQLQPGDEVILPTYVCGSVQRAVQVLGCVPVLCDVGEHWLMTPETVAPVLTAKTKAIIAVHLFGLSADIPALQGFGIPLIEDACQALGGTLDGKPLGSLGDVGVFSFHATKCLTTGTGGMVVSRHEALAHRLEVLQETDPRLVPLNDLQATLGLSQLARYPQALSRRQQLAVRYFEALPSFLIQTLSALQTQSMFFRFPLTAPSAFDVLHGPMAKAGIAVRRGVDTLLHRENGLNPHDFPNAEARFRETLSIPLYPDLSTEAQERILHTLLATCQPLLAEVS